MEGLQRPEKYGEFFGNKYGVNLFTNDLQDDATQSYISQAVWLDQGVYQDRSDDCLA